MDEQVEILMKEYDVMRNEIRLYINKYYIAMTVILGIFTAGIFKTSQGESGFKFIWVPYIIAAIIGYMTLVSFFINKTAGYVRHIEWRINKIQSKETDEGQGTEDVRQGLLLWESFYADYGMNRDSGRQFASLFTWALAAFGLVSVAMMSLVIAFGYEEAKRLDFARFSWISPERLFLFSSIIFLTFSIYAYWRVNTKVREEVRKLNKELAALYQK
ncbi:MAG: hypothetical protein U1C55_05280 [Smithellaceae bacterium]|nr:hypothetical protein [Smithellaceae bacterium]